MIFRRTLADRLRLSHHGIVAPAVLLIACAPPVANAQLPFDFAPPIEIEMPFNLYPTCIAAADVNHDGWIDLAVTGRNNDGLMMLLMGNGPASFDDPVEFFIGRQTDWAAFRDFDMDGELDLAIAVRSGTGPIIILRGFGDGTFGDRVDYPVGRSPTSFVARDLDGDEACDIVVANNGSDDATVLLNAGDGTFITWQTIDLAGPLDGPAGPFYSTWSDFDNDGDPDVVIAHLSSGHVSVLLNQGDGTFSSPLTISIMLPTCVAADDMNGDGEIDILTADMTDSTGGFAVLENQGNAFFEGLTHVHPLGGWAWFIETPDLNGDTRPDVALTDVFNGLILFLPNETEREITFGFAQPVFIGSFPRFVLPINLDADCDIDILIADIGTHDLTILINETEQVGDCPMADLNDDLQIDTGDLLMLLGEWGAFGSDADMNYDGRVDVHDLLFLLEQWGN